MYRQMMLIAGAAVGTLYLGLWAEMLPKVLSVLMRAGSEIESFPFYCQVLHSQGLIMVKG